MTTSPAETGTVVQRQRRDVLFPTHLLAGYLVGRRWELSPYWAVAGAALPDLLDKSLATVGVFTLYQTVAHSFLVFAGGGVVAIVGRRRGWSTGRKGLALWAGWASHLLLDAAGMVINGRPADAQFIAWPFVRHVPAVQLPPIEFFFHYLWTPSFLVEVGMWIVAGFVLLRER